MNTTLATTARTALVAALAACGTSGDGTEIDTPSGPLAIQPQPIPDDGFAEHFKAGSLVATATATGLDLSGVVTSDDPAPGGSNAGPLAAIDTTLFTPIVSTTSDASGAFVFHLSGASLGDHLFLFFPADNSLPSALDVVATAIPTASDPCLTFDGATSLLLPTIAAGTTASVAGTFSSTCASTSVVDRIAFLGDDVLTAPSVGFTLPSNGDSASETFLVHPAAGTTTYLTYVIVAAGADRHVIALHGSSK